MPSLSDLKKSHIDIIHDELNKELNKTENTKYTTENGIKEFNCKDGYVDNIIIEGETLVNLVRTNLPVVIWDNNRLVINLADCNYFEGIYTLFNFSDKRIVFDIGEATTNNWIRTSALNAKEVKTFNINNGERIFNVNGLFEGGWANNDTSKNEFRNSIVLLKGDHTNKSISLPCFEGLKSVGQGDKIEILSTPISNNLIPQNYTKGEGHWDAVNNVGTVFNDSNWYRILEYIPVKPSTQYTGIFTGTQVIYYDENKNVINHYQSDLVLGYKYYIFTTPQNAKYIRVSYPKNIENYIHIFEGIKHDKKTIPVTLRSLPNGIKDTIEKRGNKYVLVQRCGEYVVNNSIGYSMGSAKTNTIDHCIAIPNIKCIELLVNKPQDEIRNIYCDALKEVSFKYISNKGGWIYADEEFITHEGNYVVMSLSKSKVNSQGADAFYSWIKDNPITVVYELATPIITELPNFNLQTFEGDTTLLINSEAIQGECEFEVTNSKGSEIEVLKDKVSSLDDYESGYEHSSELIYLNGTYKPDFAENPYIVRIGKMCILHCAIANDAPQRGMHILKLPSFALPKDHHRCAGRAKINNDTITPVLVDYDITLDNTVQLWTTLETTRVTEMYIHMIWEVE